MTYPVLIERTIIGQGMKKSEKETDNIIQKAICRGTMCTRISRRAPGAVGVKAKRQGRGRGRAEQFKQQQQRFGHNSV